MQLDLFVLTFSITIFPFKMLISVLSIFFYLQLYNVQCYNCYNVNIKQLLSTLALSKWSNIKLHYFARKDFPSSK